MSRYAGIIDIIIAIINMFGLALSIAFLPQQVETWIIFFALGMSILMIITGILVLYDNIVGVILSWLFALYLIIENVITLNILSLSLWLSILKIKLLIS